MVMVLWTAEDCRFHKVALVSVNGASDLACLGAGATWGHRAYLCDGDNSRQTQQQRCSHTVSTAKRGTNAAP